MLSPLPAEPFDATETAMPRVDTKSLVTVRQSRYSVPVALAGLKVQARIGARESRSATPARPRATPRAVALATTGALTAGAIGGRAVAFLGRRAQAISAEPPAPLTDLEPRLHAHERPAPDLSDYDQLLGGTR